MNRKYEAVCFIGVEIVTVDIDVDRGHRGVVAFEYRDLIEGMEYRFLTVVIHLQLQKSAFLDTKIVFVELSQGIVYISQGYFFQKPQTSGIDTQDLNVLDRKSIRLNSSYLQ